MKEQVSLEMSKECGTNLKKPRLFRLLIIYESIVNESVYIMCVYVMRSVLQDQMRNDVLCKILSSQDGISWIVQPRWN